MDPFVPKSLFTLVFIAAVEILTGTRIELIFMFSYPPLPPDTHLHSQFLFNSVSDLTSFDYQNLTSFEISFHFMRSNLEEHITHEEQESGAKRAVSPCLWISAQVKDGTSTHYKGVGRGKRGVCN
ncbi:hypothetical protein STEG23_000278, partial [Scotinomys teguina]